MRRNLPGGMTLIELLVVVAIIGMLTTLVLPAVQAARETARRAHCHSNLRQLGFAMSLHAERDGEFPIGCIGCKFVVPPPSGPPARQRFIAWNVQLLPFLEQPDLWNAFDFSIPSYRPANKDVGVNVLPVFLCPSTPSEVVIAPSGLWKGTAFTDYGGVYGVEGPGHDLDPPDANSLQWLRDESLGVLVYEKPVREREVTDGLSNTACIAETSARRLAQETEWVNGHNVFAQEASTRINGSVNQINEIGSPHPGGASLAFCDGHVEFVAETIEQQVLQAMLTKAGGEP
jgi:prepilin-type N-terminal cleavage/methylation domain-containing protein/prepilin-type processing-associated H-X9-DG protein